MLSGLKHTKVGRFWDDILEEARALDHVPERLIVKPVDLWPADPERAQYFAQQFSGMHPQNWPDDIHDFSFLRDFPALGSLQVRELGLYMITRWAKSIGQQKMSAKIPAFTAGRTGRRLSFWISHYEYFVADCDPDSHEQFFESLVIQAKYLRKSVFAPQKDLCGLDYINALKGYIYCALAIDGLQKDVSPAMDILHDELEEQILDDGGHISRKPAVLMAVLQDLLDIRMALTAAAYKVPAFLPGMVQKIIPALRCFILADGKFATLQGTLEGDKETIERLQRQAVSKTRPSKSLRVSGYEQATLGRMHVLMDCGRAPPAPYDMAAHAAPLSTELSYANERIFVSCGTAPNSKDWAEMLRNSSAHSMLELAGRNAYEILETGGIGRSASLVDVKREDTKGACLIEAAHDGYAAVNGYTHSRKIFMSDQGRDIRGEDILRSNKAPKAPQEVIIRFHLHPRVLVSLVKDNREALLRLPSGIGFRFFHEAGQLCLEDSIYFGEGGEHFRKTKQLVIYGVAAASHESFKWALQREGQNLSGQEDMYHGETATLL